ncbi:hypothetical protein I9W82_001564 [Candida metapsilosis]|uniref:Uncharacterized protein n=1 Tax=Candida metapsilosis TaxID=273372 RepID=A0A8H7ZGH2_9ASCO|nr:hypothetical protein I9W82_001564 [Candida metapsilosis]
MRTTISSSKMQLMNLPLEVLDQLFNNVKSLSNVPFDIRICCRYLVLNYVDFPSTLTLDVWKVLPYLQVWPGSEIQVGFWGLFLYSYPYCIDTWNSFNGTELRVSDVTTLKMQSGWPELSELERKLIDWLIGLAEVAPQIELARKDVFSKSKSVYLYFCPQSLTNFAAIDRGIDPEYLCIKIIPDESRTIVQELSSHKYENLERFSLEYLGHEGFVNVLELLWSLNTSYKYDSFTLTTSVFTFGNDASKTSAKIIAELTSKFKRFIVYTVDKGQSLPVRRIPLTPKN